MRSSRRIKYPAVIRFCDDRLIAEALAAAAERRRTTLSEYIRDAVRRQLLNDGVRIDQPERVP